MGSCIICGADADGHVCRSHEEDVYFEFEGSRPDQLTPDRYYKGTVDGFADFGVFVDVGDEVTGLLHTSELDRRLESLDWQSGDTVFVQVKNVRDNGNVDLGWSIRQHESEFRGHVIDHPEDDRLPDEGNGREGAAEPADTPSPSDAEPEPEPDAGGEAAAEADAEPAPAEPDPEPAGGSGGGAAMESPLQRTTVDALDDQVGSPVRIEGTIVEARQTSGPTIFEVRDETGTVECAAFESAGVRAYPEAEAGDVVRLDGVVEERRGEIQIETEDLAVLAGEERAAVEERLEAAIEERARPETTDLLAEHPAVAAIREDLVAAATAIRRAVFASRPVVVRHNGSVDGYLAGAALERALLPLIRAEHEEADAEYHYVDRRPLDGRVYGMDDAMRDTTTLLEAEERHGEPVPLFVFVNAGSTEESRDGFELLEQYGADRVVIDGDHPDASMTDAAGTFVSPHLDGRDDAASTSTTALCATVAAIANPDVRDDVRHLPAASYWRDPPAAYVDLAAEAGYDADDARALREAVALEAFYGAYDDKRELIEDLLFDGGDLVEHASEQFRERVADEVRTARSHLEEWSVAGHALATLDLDAFTHGHDFPPADVLLPELAADAGEFDAIVGAGADELRVWSDAPVDMRAVGEYVAGEVPEAGVEIRGGRDGTLVFLAGERDAVLAATVEAIADELA